MAAVPTTSQGRLLAGELAAIRGELARVDAKAGILLSLSSAGIAFVATTAPKVSGAEAVLLIGSAAALTAAALVLLLTVLRPRLGASSFNSWATRTPAQILAAADQVTEDQHAANELGFLSYLISRKFRQLQRGVDLLALGVVLLAVAIVISVIR